MKQYYIIINKQRIGPLSLEQLVQNGLSPESLVWSKGMADWTPAKQLPELEHYFATGQLAVPQQYQQPVQQPQYQQPMQQPQYQQPVQQQYQQPAQQQYQQPVQQQYQQPVQQQYQQPVQQQYRQPQYQQPAYQQPGFQQPAGQSSLKETPSQKIFRIILILFTGIFGITNFVLFILALIFLIGGGTGLLSSVLEGLNIPATLKGAGITLFLLTLVMFIISVVQFLKLIKGKGFGVITIGFYLLTLILIFVSIGFDYIWGWKIMYIISIALAVFAIVPVENISEGWRYKALYEGATKTDYILLALYVLLIILFFSLVLGTFV